MLSDLSRQHSEFLGCLKMRTDCKLDSEMYLVFIIAWTFLHNVSVYFGGYVIFIYYRKISHVTESSFQLQYPDYWLAAGCVLGGLCSFIFGKKFGTKALFLVIRFVQITAIIIMLVFDIMQKYQWIQNYRVFGMDSTIMLQGFIDSMSQIASPIYVMEMICDRDVRSPVTLLLLVSTVLPLYMSSFIAVMLSKHRLFLTFGVGIFGGVFIILLLSFLFLPKASRDGIRCDKDENILYWHLQFEKQSGWLCPAVTCLVVTILTQMTGFQMYEFYASWATRLVHLPIDTDIVKSGVPFFTIFLTLPFWTKNRLPTFLITTTGILTICLLFSGIVLHGLEGGSTIYPPLPISINIIFVVCYSAGLLSLAPIVCLLLIPRRYRLAIFSVVIIVSLLDRRLVRTITPTFIELLHPFGVFWLHSGVTFIGLLYIVVAIVDQVKDRYRGIPPARCTVEEFVTQI